MEKPTDALENHPTQTLADGDELKTALARNAVFEAALQKIASGDGVGGPDAELKCADIARLALKQERW